LRPSGRRKNKAPRNPVVVNHSNRNDFTLRTLGPKTGVTLEISAIGIRNRLIPCSVYPSSYENFVPLINDWNSLRLFQGPDISKPDQGIDSIL
jgi:hypothetical protein